MKPVTQTQLENAIKQFCGDRQTSGGANYGSGHINDTYRIVLENGEDAPAEVLILQRMNTEIFTEPVLLMENIANVTGHLKKKIAENGGDPKRETLSIVSAQDGKPYYVDEAGNSGGVIRLLLTPSALTALRQQKIFIKAQLHLEIFSGCFQIFRQSNCMRQFRTFMIRRHVLRFSKKQWQRMFAVVQRESKRKLISFWRARTLPMCLVIYRQKGNFRCE